MPMMCGQRGLEEETARCLDEWMSRLCTIDGAEYCSKIRGFKDTCQSGQLISYFENAVQISNRNTCVFQFLFLVIFPREEDEEYM